MEFARQGPAVDDGCRSPNPPPHGDSSMLVIRDALLSQLQKDRLRQEIIMAELAKIERAMALRSADAERAEQAVPFAFNVQMPHGIGVVATQRDFGVDEAHDLKKNHGVHGGVQVQPEKPAMEVLVPECLEISNGTGKAAGHENAAPDECKLRESGESVSPTKSLPSSVKWSCAICQVKATSQGNLQQHFAGQKHLWNVAEVKWSKWSCAICQVKATSKGNLQQHFAGQKHQSSVAAFVSRNKAAVLKTKPTAEKKSGTVKQYTTQEESGPVSFKNWVCRFCQSNCTCKSDLEKHLKGKRHKAKIQDLLEECENMTKNYWSTQGRSDPDVMPHGEESHGSTWNCSLCQAKGNNQSVLESHLRGKRHQLNFVVLQAKALQQNMCKHKRLTYCQICNLQCNSEQMLADHFAGQKHQKNARLMG